MTWCGILSDTEVTRLRSAAGTAMKSHPEYATRCGWNALLETRPPRAPFAGERAFDLVVIGAGYTGVAAARRYAELAPQAEVALVDASVLGEGNPGRNSGFLLEVGLAHDADAAAVARLAECNRLIAATMAGIAADVRASGAACGLARAGTYRAAGGDEGMRGLERYRRFLAAAGLPFESLDREALAARLGTSYYRQGLYSPHCYLVQPAALIRALARSLPASVRLFEHTPALAVDADGAGWRVTTPGGTLRAPRVMLANNAFCRQLGIGRDRIVAMYTYAALTAPMPAETLERLGGEAEWGLLPAHRLGSTLRRTADGRFLVRSFYGYRKEAPRARIAARLRAVLERRFPGLGLPPFDAVWAGATGFTYNGAPLWGEAAPGLYVSAGCNGGGIVKGRLFGRLLAERALGRAVPDVAALFGAAGRMPPEPFRRLGFALLAGIERRRARAEV